MITRNLVARLIEEGEDKGLSPECLALCEVADAIREQNRILREQGGDEKEPESEVMED